MMTAILVAMPTAGRPRDPQPPAGDPAPLPERTPILRAAAGIALYAGAFGATFGAVSSAAGLTLAQTMTLSVVMFTGASQFAFIGVVSAGGSPFAAIPAALLLGLRNAFYGVPISFIIRPRGRMRGLTAHLVIDETTAMAVAQPTAAARRYAFWATGSMLFALWVIGSFAGAVLGTRLDPATLGLDAAAPAVFLALLWPQLRIPRGPALAVMGGVVAVVLIPLVPPGVPVIAAATVAIIVGLTGDVGGQADDRADDQGRGLAEDQVGGPTDRAGEGGR